MTIFKLRILTAHFLWKQNNSSGRRLLYRPTWAAYGDRGVSAISEGLGEWTELADSHRLRLWADQLFRERQPRGESHGSRKLV